MTQVCPQCNFPVPREGRRFCNQCGADLREYATQPGAPVVTNTGTPDAPGAVSSPRSAPFAAAPADTTMTASQDASKPQSVPEATLHILMRDGTVVERELNDTETRIGKGAQNDIILADASVSSTHALIRRENGTYLLSDLGSRNGTMLNEARLTEPRPLHHGDLIKMGHCTLTFRLQDVESTASMPRTMVLGDLQPPPPPAPPAPKKIAVTEEALAEALAAARLVAPTEIERVRTAAGGPRLVRALLEENLVTEIGLRDLMSRTFNIEPVDLRTVELDAETAIRLRPEFVRERQLCPISQPPNQLTLAVADPTDRQTIEEIERRTGNTATLRLALPSEIAAKLDAYFTPRLIGVTSAGEKIEMLLNQHEIAIGKAAHNKLVISDPTVSSTHAIVLVRDGGYSIVDLGSSNGTFINGQQLGSEAHTLQHGDKIQLGQVVLTFRNPAETTENKTSRLSPEALEEIRRRAALQSAAAGGVRTDPSSWSIPAVNVAPAPNPAVVAEADDEKAERKKKKKDKNSWFSPNSLSRILAQVLGATVSLLGSYYLVRHGMRDVEKKTGGVTEETAAISERFKPASDWREFSTGVFSGKPEASGVAYAPGTEGVLFVSDDDSGHVLWMQLDENGRQVGALKKVPLGVKVKNPEAITYGNSFFYVLSSHANPQDTTHHALVRFAFDPTAQALRGPAETITNLRQFLLEQVPEIAGAGAAAGDEGGLNIEGLAWDRINERLLLGLRSPLLGNQAVLVPLRLRDPRGAFTLDNLQVDNPHVIILSLEGQGVRDLTFDPRLNSFLIISGAPENAPKTKFGLWEWTGQSDARPTKLLTLGDAMKPEGITTATINGRSFVFLVGDGGGYLKLDYTNTR